MNIYPFDEQSIEVQFNARPGAETPHVVAHRLRKPTLQELLEREQGVSLEIHEVSNREDTIVSDDEGANCRLWDKLILEARGYRGMDGWTPVTDEMKAAMRAGHKTTAIRGMYAGTASVANDEDGGVSLGGDDWTIRQAIGADTENPQFEILHILREPTEGERSKFKRAASSAHIVRGAKKSRTKIVTSLRAFVELYDALVIDITGGTVNGQYLSHDNRAQFLAAVDPTWKRLIVQTLLNAIEAALLD